MDDAKAPFAIPIAEHPVRVEAPFGVLRQVAHGLDEEGVIWMRDGPQNVDSTRVRRPITARRRRSSSLKLSRRRARLATCIMTTDWNTSGPDQLRRYKPVRRSLVTSTALRCDSFA
jgi:hypothetical protein